MEQSESSARMPSNLILLIGLPGSGKSTFARQLIANCPSYQLVSTDEIRAQLFGDEGFQGSWMQVWRQVEREFHQAVQQQAPTVYDATNAKRSYRQEAIALARQSGFTLITGIWLDIPLAVCLERNRERSRQVPEEIVLQMHRQLSDAPPSLAEGLDELVRLTQNNSG
ncbi:AAA family ATPase [Desertifilum tharense]|uniref:AAA family ATPase n=2 Tax=Desertifilum tharense IPPAS B-1220 TaxID=1781255 RepID=A0ACD5H0H1_9CYAN|nr:AAA family ATPase [Desertifilum tharense]MDL5052471.1 AAA family ATPase [Oscillatoria laete-virens NRMC-F 0139]